MLKSGRMLLGLMLALGWNSPAEAQSIRSGVADRAVTVAIIEDSPLFRDTYEAVIVRRGNHADLIVMRQSDANGELLDSAMRILLHARNSNTPGVTTNSFVVLGVRPIVSSADWAAEHLQHAKGVLEQLYTSPFRELPGVGRARALEVHPPTVRSSSPPFGSAQN